MHVDFVSLQKDIKVMVKHSIVPLSQPGDKESQGQTAAYIFDMLKELEQIAGRERIEPLDRLLKIACEEAGRISNAA
jgi:hypothetical protein